MPPAREGGGHLRRPVLRRERGRGAPGRAGARGEPATVVTVLPDGGTRYLSEDFWGRRDRDPGPRRSTRSASTAAEAYPEECCGALLGRKGDGRARRARRADREPAARSGRAPLRGVARRTTSASSGSLAENLALLGFYHSHPDHPGGAVRLRPGPRVPLLPLPCRARSRAGVPARSPPGRFWRRPASSSEKRFSRKGRSYSMPRILLPDAAPPLRGRRRDRRSRRLRPWRRRSQRSSHAAPRASEAPLRRRRKSLRSFVNLYKNDEDVRYLEKDETPLSPATRSRSCRRSREAPRPTPRRRAQVALERGDPPLLAPPDHAGGRRRGAEEAEGRARARRSAPAGSARRSRCISRPRASGRSGSSTSTSSTTRTFSARSSTALPTSAGRSSRPRRSGSAT